MAELIYGPDGFIDMDAMVDGDPDTVLDPGSLRELQEALGGDETSEPDNDWWARSLSGVVQEAQTSDDPFPGDPAVLGDADLGVLADVAPGVDMRTDLTDPDDSVGIDGDAPSAHFTNDDSGARGDEADDAAPGWEGDEGFDPEAHLYPADDAGPFDDDQPEDIW